MCVCVYMGVGMVVSETLGYMLYVFVRPLSFQNEPINMVNFFSDTEMGILQYIYIYIYIPL